MTKQTRLHALETQIRRLGQRLEELQSTSYRYSWIRVIVVVAGVSAAGLALFFGEAWLSGVCLAAAVLLFGLVVRAHQEVDHSIRRHRIWRQIKSGHVARASLDWEHLPTTFPHQPRPEHPFEADLDLVGSRSIHRLLDTAVSFEGSQRLRDWLTTPVPDLKEIARRQELVRELAPLSLFRDRITLNAMAATGARKTWEADHLVSWLEKRAPASSLRLWLLLFSVLILLNAALLIANLWGPLPPWWQVTVVLYVGLWLARARSSEAVWDQARALQGALKQLHAVFSQLEVFSYRYTPHLKVLCAPFLDPTHRPSRYLGRIAWVVTAMGLRTNPFIGLALNLVLPWDAYFAYRLNRTKAAMARYARAWMDVWFELEALSSLANLAYLNPAYSFPHVRAFPAEGQSSILSAQALGHPLIPDRERVCNDLTISELGQVIVITGSNMAGKSVFLKTVGVNLALAYAGGPVNAYVLASLPFRLFTCMGISDSVTDGISFFYAEVRRLKALLADLERDHPLPLLYCIDEIFRGTNNRERLIGSRAYVRTLAGKQGTGLIATHDLELARLADEMPQVQNYHFRDRIVGGRMAFDYTLRPGPCPTTNALTIMQLEGLPVSTAQGPLPAGQDDGSSQDKTPSI